MGSNEYQQSMLLSRNMKNNVYPYKHQFYYIKVRFMGVKIIKACFSDAFIGGKYPFRCSVEPRLGIHILPNAVYLTCFNGVFIFVRRY